jgi:hypothetical protein
MVARIFTLVAAVGLAAAAPQVSVYADGQPQATAQPTTAAAVSVYTDGQVSSKTRQQKWTAALSRIMGADFLPQPQATVQPTSAAAPVSVYSDGQVSIQRSCFSHKKKACAKSSQPQATVQPTSAAAPVSVYTDGQVSIPAERQHVCFPINAIANVPLQPQATVQPTTVAPVPTTGGAPVSVYTDGQPQATVQPTTLASASMPPKSNGTIASATPAPIQTAGGSTFGYSGAALAAAACLAAAGLL